jgi:hypothetical protein
MANEGSLIGSGDLPLALPGGHPALQPLSSSPRFLFPTLSFSPISFFAVFEPHRPSLPEGLRLRKRKRASFLAVVARTWPRESRVHRSVHMGDALGSVGSATPISKRTGMSLSLPIVPRPWRRKPSQRLDPMSDGLLGIPAVRFPKTPTACRSASRGKARNAALQVARRRSLFEAYLGGSQAGMP